MRDQWYADNRDVVKWGGLVHLATVNRIDLVLQVAFYRADSRAMPELVVGDKRLPLSAEVLAHFRSIDNIQGLATRAGLRIEIFKNPFDCTRHCPAKQAARRDYFTRLGERVRGYGPKRLIVFLDPDTGIAPRHADWQHVTAREIRSVNETLKPGDFLVLYQHARRRSDWLATTRVQFAEAVGRPDAQVRTLRAPNLARDVALFAVEKDVS